MRTFSGVDWLRLVMSSAWPEPVLAEGNVPEVELVVEEAWPFPVVLLEAHPVACGGVHQMTHIQEKEEERNDEPGAVMVGIYVEPPASFK